ncbi:MAG: hypothetical protein DMF06_17030 [Verrucomicrobia bacterium]|nr:MAG: hypothetical protein DMF06_17030 [Verrucomicrobiota bacterium]
MERTGQATWKAKLRGKQRESAGSERVSNNYRKSKREEHAELGCRRVDGQMREGSARAKGIRESKLETTRLPVLVILFFR